MKNISTKSATTSKNATIAKDWCVLVLLTGAMMFSILDRAGIAVLIEPIKHDLHLGDAAFGLFNGLAFGLFYTLMGLPLGWLADRWSRKGTIALGIGAWSIATACCGMAGSFWTLLGARIFVGAGEAGLAPAAYGIIHDRFGRANLATAISILQMGGAFGAGCALLVTSFVFARLSAGSITDWPLIGALHPWQQTFIFLALPGILFVLAVPFISDQRPNPLGHTQERSDISLLAALHLNALVYFYLFGGMAMIVTVGYALISWMPAVLGREFGWAPARAGALYGGIMLFCAPAGLFCGGLLCDFLTRRGHRRAHVLVPLGAAIIALPAALCLALAHGTTLLLSAAAVVNFCTYLPVGVAPAYVQLATPAEARGRVSAFYVMLVNLFGLGVASVLVGVISSRFPGVPTALRDIIGYGSFLCMLIAVVLLIQLQRPGRSTHVPQIPNSVMAEPDRCVQ